MAVTLVKHPYPMIKRGGGGTGYLYNLRAGVEAYGQDSDIRIEVTPSIIAPPGPPPPPEVPPSFARRVARRLKHEVRSRLQKPQEAESAAPLPPDQIPDNFETMLAGHLLWGKNLYGWMDRSYALQLFECDLLFANDIWMADYLQQLCPELAKQKLALISHSPTWTGVELAAEILPEVSEARLKTIPCVQQLIARHQEVMSSLRAIMWPCEEAVSEYPEWNCLRIEGKTNDVFGETGVLRPDVQNPPEKLRQEWGIDPEQRVVLFIGRAHPHKGFDRFLDWADAYQRTGETQYVFVQAGAAPKTPRDISAIRPVGYITDNGAAYLAADLVVIPNLHSYLDIGLLEAMSLGAKIAITPTGGHRMIARICPELPLIPEGDPEQVWLALQQIAQEYAEDSQRQTTFQNLWETRFSVKPFYANHLRVAKELL